MRYYIIATSQIDDDKTVLLEILFLYIF